MKKIEMLGKLKSGSRVVDIVRACGLNEASARTINKMSLFPKVVFKKQLSRYQWVSLIILTLGCVIKQLSSIKKEEVSPTHTVSILTTLLSNVVSLHIFLMLVQVFCSCLAGVYNEKLLKDTGAEVHIMVQNVFMYIDSIICNALVLLCRGDILSAFTTTSLSQVC
nr:UDP-galactose transporter senju-like [Cherax quadricarinatus]